MPTLTELISWTATFSTVLSFLLMWIWLAVGFAVMVKATIDVVRPLLGNRSSEPSDDRSTTGKRDGALLGGPFRASGVGHDSTPKCCAKLGWWHHIT